MKRPILFIVCMIVSASVTLAAVQALALNINSTNKYAWGENIGWVNFGTTQGDVDVSATAIDGYAWGENIGWISMTCSNTSSCGTVNYGVTVNGSTGVLAGYAWGENVGWISFNCSNTSSCGTVNYGVTIDTATGIFSGYAWGENVGWISFNCSNTGTCGTVDYKVQTSAFPAGTATPTPTPTPETITGGGGTTPQPPAPSGSVSPTPTGSATPTPTGSFSPTPTPTIPEESETPIPTPTGSIPPPTPTGFPTPTASPPTVTPSGPPTAPGQPTVPPVVQAINTVSDALDTVARTVLGPVADVVSSTCVGPLGTVACGTTSVSTVAVSVAVAAAAAQNEVAATSFSFLQIVGIRKRAKVWGVIYDSKTKKPIPLAKIELLDAAGRVLETRFADRDGRYGFLTSPASLHTQELRVQVRVEKPGYRFPSSSSAIGTDYIVYDNVYRGGDITLHGDALVRFNIPMDPIAKTRASLSGFGLGLIGTLGDRLLSAGFYIGLIAVPVNLWLLPSTKNIIIAVIFAVTNGVRTFAIYRPYGATIDAQTKKRLPFALVTLNDLEGNRVGFAVSDEHGRFILSGEQGKDYEIVAYTPANIAPQRILRQRVRGVKRFLTRAWITADLRI